MHGAQQAVHDRLGTLDGLDPTRDPGRARSAVVSLQGALYAVMREHTPRDPTPIEASELAMHERVKQVCGTCAPGAGLIGTRQVYPCPTVRALMGMIGAKDPNG